MTDEPNPTPSPTTEPEDSGIDIPPGNHPLEIAARKGVGPLSPLGQSIWHGNTIPCVSCGQLVLRNAQQCDACEQDLSQQMIAKMKAHAGPWYVLEHVRQFPGVTLDRIIRQVRRGVISDTSIIRGPWTDHQWRFTIETPGLCLLFSRCWHCHDEVAPTDSICQSCQMPLTYQTTPSTSTTEYTIAPAPSHVNLNTSQHNLNDLSAALTSGEFSNRPKVWDEPAHVGGISTVWIAAGLVVVALAILSILAQSRSSQATPTSIPTPVSLVQPTPAPNATNTTTSP